MRRSLLSLLLAVAIPAAAHADPVIFNLGPANGDTLRSSATGPAQGVIVSTTTTISGFAFYAEPMENENLDFFITDGTGTTLLYSGIESVTTSGSYNWIESNALSFTLDAGSEYYFGVIGDSSTGIGYIYPTIVYSANGLTADPSGNANDDNGYAGSPVPLSLGSGATDIGLQLYAPTTVTPEPSSLVLLGTGALGLIGAVRRRFHQA